MAIVMFTLGTGMMIAPVTIRNLRLQDDFVLVSSNAGLNYYLGNSGDYDARVGTRPGADFDDLIESHVRAGRRVGPEMSGYFFSQARKYAAENPSGYVGLQLYKTYLHFNGNEIMRNQEIYPFREYSEVLRLLLWKFRLPGGMGLAFPFGVFLPLAWTGCLLAFRKLNGEALLLLAYRAAYTITVIAFFVTARYRLPEVLPMILLIAYGWSNVREWWRPGGMRVAAVAGMAGLLILSNWGIEPMPAGMNPDAYYSLAGTLADQGNLTGAEYNFKKALEMNQADAASWVNLGLRVYQERGQLERAEACYRKAIEVRPGFAPAYYNLGVLAEIKNTPARAESLYLKAIRLNPIMEGPYVNIGALALARGDFERARRFYLKASEVNPENPRALVGLGVTMFQLEGFDRAMNYFNRAIDAAPEFPDIYFNLALVFARSGRHLEAANYALWTLKLDPADEEAYTVYARQMRAAGRAGDARRYLEAAIREHPDLAGPRRALELLMQ
jgi:tetratricopeptide (TPR) repeat protein